jgi:hypothetical protein
MPAIPSPQGNSNNRPISQIQTQSLNPVSPPYSSSFSPLSPQIPVMMSPGGMSPILPMSTTSPIDNQQTPQYVTAEQEKRRLYQEAKLKTAEEEKRKLFEEARVQEQERERKEREEEEERLRVEASMAKGKGKATNQDFFNPMQYPMGGMFPPPMMGESENSFSVERSDEVVSGRIWSIDSDDTSSYAHGSDDATSWRESSTGCIS